MRPGPHCKECGREKDTQFNMFPKAPGYKFGEICVDCETRIMTKVDL